MIAYLNTNMDNHMWTFNVHETGLLLLVLLILKKHGFVKYVHARCPAVQSTL